MTGHLMTNNERIASFETRYHVDRATWVSDDSGIWLGGRIDGKHWEIIIAESDGTPTWEVDGQPPNRALVVATLAMMNDDVAQADSLLCELLLTPFHWITVTPLIMVFGRNYSNKSKFVQKAIDHATRVRAINAFAAGMDEDLLATEIEDIIGVENIDNSNGEIFGDILKVGTINRGTVPQAISPLARERMAGILPGWDGVLGDFGISCLVPVVEAAVVTRPGVTVYEHPEMGLHPEAIVELGTLFLEASKHRTQILETHSEHIILRVLRHIRCGDLDPSHLAVIYIHPDGTHQRLHVDAEGEFIDRWPGGFFDERYPELFE